jgi:hypothetical protein
MGSLKRLVSVLLALSVCGCASWDEPVRTPPSFPAPRISRDMIVLEIEFVRFGEDQRDELSGLWGLLDEQQLSPELRRRLAVNGLRCGVIESQLPPVLQEALAEKRQPLQQLALGETPDADRSFENHRQLTCRFGTKYKIVTTPEAERRVVMINQGDRVRGREFLKATGLFSLVCTPLGDGLVTLQLTPQVEHGEFRQRIVPGQSHFIVDPSREQTTFESLGFETTLSPGATLVLSGSTDSKGLGGWYFGEGADRGLMLVRLVQTQLDNLFSDDTLGL